MVGVTIDSLVPYKSFSEPVKWQLCILFSRFVVLSSGLYFKKAQQKLVLGLYITKQKFDFSIVVLVSFIVCHLFRILSFDDTLLGWGVTYSRPISYASYPIRVALPLSRFPLRFALTYPRRLSCPLPRSLICQSYIV